MVYTDDMLEYVDMIKFKDVNESAGAILNGTMDILSEAGILRYSLGTLPGTSLLAYNITWTLFLGLLLLFMVRWM